MKSTMTFSERGAKYLQAWEDKDGKPALRAYLDEAGVWTIGTGHTRGVKKGDTCTLDQAEKWLVEDCQFCVDAINKCVQVDLTQSEFDALVIWIFNVGVGAFIGSTALKRLNKGDYEGCSVWMGRFIYITDPVTKKKVVDNGLINRRAKEAVLWSEDFVSTASGTATPSAPVATKVTQTTTGKLTISSIVAKVGAAVTGGLAMAQDHIGTLKGAKDTLAGFDGYWEIAAACLLLGAVVFELVVLMHKSQVLNGESQ